MRLNSRNPKRHIYIPNFNFLVQFRGESCEEQTQKIRKTYNRTTFSGLWGSTIKLKCWDSHKAHLESLLNAHAEFQLSSSIWEEDWMRTSFFHGQKDKTPSYLHPKWSRRLNTWYVIRWNRFCAVNPSAPPRPNSGTTEFRPEVIPTPEYQTARQSKPIL